MQGFITVFFVFFSGYGCIPCPVGKFHNLDMQTCDSCPVAYYQDETGKTACKRCAGTSKTSTEGATSFSQCIGEKNISGFHFLKYSAF